jgi:hypothetical protein
VEGVITELEVKRGDRNPNVDVDPPGWRFHRLTAKDTRLWLRPDCRQPGHYTRFGVTSGWPVTRPEHGQLGFFCLDWSMGASAIYYH